MSTEKKRVHFLAPHPLVERADTLATVLNADRTDIILMALREYLRDAAHDDQLKQEIADAYYDDEIAFDQLKTLVGGKEAANFRVLKQQLSEDYIDDLVEISRDKSDAGSDSDADSEAF
jgi:hypothetical protein